MSLVDDTVAGPRSARETVRSETGTRRGPVPCVARPGTLLVHPDGRCECFFGGRAPEFMRGAFAPPTREPSVLA